MFDIVFYVTELPIAILNDRTSTLAKQLFNRNLSKSRMSGFFCLRSATLIAPPNKSTHYISNRAKVERATKKLKVSINSALSEAAAVQRFVFNKTDVDYKKQQTLMEETLRQQHVTGVGMPSLKDVNARVDSMIISRFGKFMPTLETVLNERRTVLDGKDFCHEQLITITRVSGYKTGTDIILIVLFGITFN